jgi:hypothetical protein
LDNLSDQFVVSPRAIEFDFYFRLAIVTGKKNSEAEFIIATAKTVKTFLIAETIAITASSFFLLPSIRYIRYIRYIPYIARCRTSFFLLPSAIAHGNLGGSRLPHGQTGQGN